MSFTSRRLRGLLLVGAALALIPWIAVLVGAVQAEEAQPLAAFWVGIDAAEAVGLAGVGAAALGASRVRPWLAPLAVLTAALLGVDAVVDVSTATGDGATLVAWVMAVLAELPMAAVCLSLLAGEPSGLEAGDEVLDAPHDLLEGLDGVAHRPRDLEGVVGVAHLVHLRA